MKKIKTTKKTKLTIFIVLRFLVVISLILQLYRGEWNNAFLCILTLILFTIPTIIKKKFKVELPSVLEGIIYLFIFSAEILGEINNFYGIFPYWDSMLHTINGFLAAAIGFALIDLLNKESKLIVLSPIFVALTAFCFSMTVGVLWEFFEYAGDQKLNLDMQKDFYTDHINTVILDETNTNTVVKIEDINKVEITYNNDQVIVLDNYIDIGIKDTMKDLFVNFIGAIVFSIIGLLYIKNRDGFKIAEMFIPTKKKTT